MLDSMLVLTNRSLNHPNYLMSLCEYYHFVNIHSVGISDFQSTSELISTLSARRLHVADLDTSGGEEAEDDKDSHGDEVDDERGKEGHLGEGY